jgi:hypothetical protein
MRLRWFVHKSTFDTEQQAGRIGNEDICFILDRLRIYTRSSSFDFSNRPIYQGETSTSDSAGTWTVTINGITELYDGLTVKVRITTGQGSSYSTLNVNNLGANPIWFGYGVPLTSSTPLTSNQEVTLTYRTTASASGITIGGTSYTRGWVMSESLKTTVGDGLDINGGSLELDYGAVESANTTQPVTGSSVYNAIPHTYLKTASVSGTTLTLTTQNDSEVTYSHPTATATTIAEADGRVLSSVTVNELGHVTAIASKTLAAADIPSLSWNKITSDKPTTISGYGITDAHIASGVVTLGENTIDPVTLSTNQTVSGQKTFSNAIIGDVLGNATTATTAQNLVSKGTSDYFYMADGSISNGYDLIQAMVDQWSSDAGGTLASYQCSSTVYDDIFTS